MDNLNKIFNELVKEVNQSAQDITEEIKVESKTYGDALYKLSQFENNKNFDWENRDLAKVVLDIVKANLGNEMYDSVISNEVN